jgi:hypothetical protein
MVAELPKDEGHRHGGGGMSGMGGMGDMEWICSAIRSTI